MEIQGEIVWVGQTQEGTSSKGNKWKKKQFKVRYEGGSYPKEILFDCLDDNIINKLSVGLQVNVKFDIVVREYNGKMFNNISIWRDGLHAVGNTSVPTGQVISQQSQPVQAVNPAPQPQPKQDDQLPF